MSEIAFALVGMAACVGLALTFNSPVPAIAGFIGLGVWALSGWLFRWTTAIRLLLLALLFVPSRVYKLPVSLPFDLDAFRAVLALLLLARVVEAFIKREPLIPATYLDAGIGLFLLAASLSLAVNAGEFSAAGEFAFRLKNAIYLSTFALTFYLVASTVRSVEDVVSYVDMLVVLGGVAGVFAVLERVTEYNIFYHLESFIPVLVHVAMPEEMFRGAIRVSGSTAHPIAFATSMSMLLPLGVTRAFGTSSARRRWFFAAVCCLIGIGLLLALSRTGVVGVLAAGFVLMLGFPRQRALLLGAAGGVLVAVHILFHGVIGTLIGFFTPSVLKATEVGNDNGRLADYAWSVPHIAERPLFGMGIGSLDPERGARFIDNQYMSTVLEMGVFGLLAFAYLGWRAISVPFLAGKEAQGELGALLIGFAASATVFVACSATFDTLGFPQVTYLFFVLAALCTALIAAMRSEESSGR